MREGRTTVTLTREEWHALYIGVMAAVRLIDDWAICFDSDDEENCWNKTVRLVTTIDGTVTDQETDQEVTP